MPVKNNNINCFTKKVVDLLPVKNNNINCFTKKVVDLLPVKNNNINCFTEPAKPAKTEFWPSCKSNPRE